MTKETFEVEALRQINKILFELTSHNISFGGTLNLMQSLLNDDCTSESTMLDVPSYIDDLTTELEILKLKLTYIQQLINK